MDTSTSGIVKDSIGAGVRWVLVLVSGILVKKGIITNAQGETYVSQFLPIVLGGVMALVALVWSIFQKKKANQKIDVALAMPAGTNRDTLEQKVAQT